MLFDGIKLVYGSDAENFALGTRTTMPETGVEGEMFLLNEGATGVYIKQGDRCFRFVHERKN